MSDTIATRRGFFLKAGAAISAPAAFAGSAHSEAAPANVLKARLAELEDAAALRRLSRALIDDINAGSRATLESLEGELSELIPVEFDRSARISFSSDRRAARVCIDCLAHFAEPIVAPGSVLVDMARLQGEGTIVREQPQVLEIDCERSGESWALASAKLTE